MIALTNKPYITKPYPRKATTMSESIIPAANVQTCPPSADSNSQPAANRPPPTRPRHTVRAVEGAYEVGVFLPGVKRDDVRVRLEENQLIIEATRTDATPEAWRPLHREIEAANYRLELDVAVPVDPGRISARLEDGVLSLRLPLREEAKARDIPIG